MNMFAFNGRFHLKVILTRPVLIAVAAAVRKKLLETNKQKVNQEIAPQVKSKCLLRLPMKKTKMKKL